MTTSNIYPSDGGGPKAFCSLSHLAPRPQKFAINDLDLNNENFYRFIMECDFESITVHAAYHSYNQFQPDYIQTSIFLLEDTSFESGSIKTLKR